MRHLTDARQLHEMPQLDTYGFAAFSNAIALGSCRYILAATLHLSSSSDRPGSIARISRAWNSRVTFTNSCSRRKRFSMDIFATASQYISCMAFMRDSTSSSVSVRRRSSRDTVQHPLNQFPTFRIASVDPHRDSPFQFFRRHLTQFFRDATSNDITCPGIQVRHPLDPLRRGHGGDPFLIHLLDGFQAVIL